MSAAFGTITARLARDPETKTTNSGTTICRLTLPVDTGWGDNKTTTWWTATLFGKNAERAAKFLHKGKWVCVTGAMSVRTYPKKDGGTGTSPEMTVNAWQFVGPKVDAPAESSTGNRSGGGNRTRSGGNNDGGAPFADDDIPFAWFLAPLLPALMAAGSVAEVMV